MHDPAPPPLEVAAAVIEHDRRVLACRRAPGRSAAGKWEFPGGKVEAGETAGEAVVREIREELSVEVRVGGTLRSDDTVVGERVIRLICVSAALVGEAPTGSTDHDALEWWRPGELSALDWAEPDLPMVRQLASGRAR